MRSLRYITIGEQKRYAEIAKAHGIKGYNPTATLVCRESEENVESFEGLYPRSATTGKEKKKKQSAQTEKNA
jgi:hypothetical protein